MTELTIQRTPQTIATEIYSIKGQTRDIILRSSVEIGRRLIEAKELLPHGEWGKWLADSVDYSQSTANNLMQICREYGSNSEAFGNLSYTQAVALLGVPEEEREQFIKENDVDGMSTRELQQAIKEKQQLEKQLKESEAKAESERKARDEAVKKLKALEVKSEDRASEVSRLKAELADAQADFDDEKSEKLQSELDKSQGELAAAQEKVKQLEAELKAKPIDVSAKVEVIPPEVEAELAELRKKVNQSNNPAMVKFKLQFDSIVEGFRTLLVTLDEVQVSDPDVHEKFKRAVAGLIDKMKDRL